MGVRGSAGDFFPTAERRYFLKTPRPASRLRWRLSTFTAQNLQQGQVFIKDYSENHGMLEVMEKAGIVKATGKKVTD